MTHPTQDPPPEAYQPGDAPVPAQSNDPLGAPSAPQNPGGYPPPGPPGGYPGAYPPPPAGGRGGSSTGIVIIIAIVVLLLLCLVCGAGAALFYARSHNGKPSTSRVAPAGAQATTRQAPYAAPTRPGQPERSTPSQAAGPLITSPMVIAEAAYLINRELGPVAERALYTAIIDDALIVESLWHGDWIRVHQLVGQYQDLPLGGTDASVIALAGRFSATQVATLDHRHFSIVRPAHTAAFTLLP